MNIVKITPKISILLTILLLIYSCKDHSIDPNNNSTSSSSSSSGSTCSAPTSLNVLFIGNSYTSYNNLPVLVNNLATAGGLILNADSYMPGGYWLSNHNLDATAISKINSQVWDVVILQDQSQVPGWRPEHVTNLLLPHAQSLVDKISNNNPSTRVLYYMTWGKRDGDTANCGYYPLVCTYEGNTISLQDGYEIYAVNTGGDIAPVGLAWSNVVADPSIPFTWTDLFNPDGSHPSFMGSYFTACVFYASLYQRSPVGLSYHGGFASNIAYYLQEKAWYTVTNYSGLGGFCIN